MRSSSIAVAVVLAVLAASHSRSARGQEPRRPNVLLICVDDLKPALGCYGDRLARSPHIDALAARGLVFERAYCNQAVCAPSRNSLLTGLRPQTLGIYDLGTNFRHAVPEAITLPQCFKRAGYRSEGLGKIFHVGHGNHEDPASWSVPHYKTQVVAYAAKSGDQRELTREEALFANKSAKGRPRGAPFEAADVPDNAYPDGAVADEAIRRLQAAAEKPGEPFFLAVGFVKPHLPFCAPQKYWDLHDPAAFELAERQTPPEGAPQYAPQFGGELRQYQGIPAEGPIPEDTQRKLIHGYYAAVSYMDAQVGRVIDELDRLKLAENTIIVLWGDHGWHLGDHGIWCKHTNYEQAARIPLVVVAPGVTKAGSRTSNLAETVDVYPTLCELACVALPDAQKLDGQSLVPVLSDPQATTKEAIFHVYPRNPRGKGPLVGRAVRTERYRLVQWKKPGERDATAELELYDYETDSAETRNLASAKPEVVAALTAILARQPEARPQIRPQAEPPQPSPQPQPPPKPGAAERPNIILCMADDQGWGDMAYSGHPRLKTPFFDEMAKSGLRLDRFYAAAPVCSPTRGSVLTGRTPNRYGVFSWGHSIRPQEATIAEMLREAGYATGHFGKWHLGSVLKDADTSPGANGFDEWLSAPNFFEIDSWLSRMGKAEKIQGESSEVVVAEALKFIRRQHEAKRPFFTVVWFGSPHAPHRGTDEDLALYADAPQPQRHFLAEITAMDRAMGQLRTALREMNAADNTLLWYCSDNGAIPQGSTGGLRGRKAAIYEGGLRVPCLIEWPSRIKVHRRIDLPAGTVDILPTLLEVAGVKQSAPHVLDGESLVRLIEGEMTTRQRPLGFWEAGVAGQRTPSDAILSAVAAKQAAGEPITDQAALGFPPWPLEWKEGDAQFQGHSAWLDGNWKLHRIQPKDGRAIRWELYDLAADPAESTDLCEKEAQRAAAMRKELEAWLASVTASLRGEDYK